MCRSGHDRTKNVSVDYPLDFKDGVSLKSALLNVFNKNRKQPKSHYRALDNVSLKIEKGERVGLIGLNGAGKSTMLRVMSRIFQPSLITVRIVGRVSPLLDFATGLELHHTGIENIRIRLMFLGGSQKRLNVRLEKLPNSQNSVNLFICQQERIQLACLCD